MIYPIETHQHKAAFKRIIFAVPGATNGIKLKPNGIQQLHRLSDKLEMIEPPPAFILVSASAPARASAELLLESLSSDRQTIQIMPINETRDIRTLSPNKTANSVFNQLSTLESYSSTTPAQTILVIAEEEAIGRMISQLGGGDLLTEIGTCTACLAETVKTTWGALAARMHSPSSRAIKPASTQAPIITTLSPL